MLDTVSVPRRSYDFEDYIDILRRNMRWLIGPAFAGLVIATVVAFTKQDVYVSGATIRVVPQQISEKMYSNFTSQDVADRINSMAQVVLNRASLTSIINALGLYKKEIKGEPMEDVIESMRKAIGIRTLDGVAAGGRTLPAMQVFFSYPDKYVAQKVCAELVSRFMSMSTQDISDTQQAAYQFIDDERSQAKASLDAAEQKLAEFRAKNAGRLPEEVSMNMQQLGNLNSQFGSYSNQLNQINERRMFLESQMNMAKDSLSAVRNPELVAHNDELNTLNAEIKKQENAILAMKNRYTDDFPDLQAARDNLAFLKKQRDDVAKQKVASTETKYDPTTATPERRNAENQIEALRVQMKALDLEEKLVKRDMGNVNNAIKQLQSRLAEVPAGQKEYDELLRDYELAKNHYLDAENKRQFAAQAIRLDSRKQGQTLELIDPASLPTSPAAPKRAQILPIGFAAGLGLGMIFVAIREFKDTSLKSLKDARLYTQLSILGSVPLLENDVVVQRRKQMMWLSWATATIAGLLIMAGSVAAHYYWGRG